MTATPRATAELVRLLDRRAAHGAVDDQLLQALIDASPLAIWVLDLEGNVLLWNPSAERLTGWTTDEVLGGPVPVVSEVEQEELRSMLSSVADGTPLVDREVSRRRKDGAVMDWSVSAAPIRNAAGKTIAIVIMAADASERKRAEASARTLAVEHAAREAAERANAELEDVLESMTDAFYAYDHEWRIRRLNRAARDAMRRINVDPETAVGRVVWDAFPKLAATPIADAMHRAARDRVPVNIEYHGPYSGRWLEVHVFPTADGIAAYTHDVTQRKKVETAQRLLIDASAALTSSLDFATTIDLVARVAVQALADWCVVDLLEEGEDGRMVARRAAAVHADPSRQAILDELSRRYPPDVDRPTLSRGVLRSGVAELVSEVPAELIDQIAQDAEQARLGRLLGVRSYIVTPLTARGRLLGVIAFISATRRYDADDLALAEELARRAALAVDNAGLFAEVRAAADRTARLQTVTAALSAATTEGEVADVMIANLDAVLRPSTVGFYRVVKGNHGGAELELLRGGGLTSEPESVPRIPLGGDTPLAMIVRTGEAVFLRGHDDFVARYPHWPADGRLGREGAWAALALVGSNGEPLASIALDFRERRTFSREERRFVEAMRHQGAQALERARLHAAEHAARVEAEQARARADEANRAKTEFLAVMSHELRTPLNAIAGYSQLLEMGIHGPLTEPQREAIARIQRNQRHLLGLINDVLNFAKLEAGYVDVDLRDVPVHETVAALEALVAPQVRAKRIAYTYEACDPTLTAHADPEKVRQILLNLISNAIKFTEPGGRITVACEADSDVVRLKVADTGRGIPTDKLERIFEPFVQVDPGRTRRHEGTGLGLAISRDLALMMHGVLSVESTLGEGSTFTLAVPRKASSG